MTACARSDRVGLSDLELVDMQPFHLEGLHRLSVSVGWPHRKSDWARNLETGHGVVAIDGLERIHGSAMYFPYTNGPAAIGMVLCHSRSRTAGLKNGLTRDVIERAGGGAAFLNACHCDINMFGQMSAHPVRGVFKYEGYLKDLPTAPLATTRHCLPADYDQIRELDHAVYASDRGPLLRALLRRSEARVIERAGRVDAFAMRRPFGRGLLIGPVAATHEADAITLVAALLADCHSHFVRIDTRLDQGRFVEFLQALGLRQSLPVTTMAFGQRAKGRHLPAYALSGHSTG